MPPRCQQCPNKYSSVSVKVNGVDGCLDGLGEGFVDKVRNLLFDFSVHLVQYNFIGVSAGVLITASLAAADKASTATGSTVAVSTAGIFVSKLIAVGDSFSFGIQSVVLFSRSIVGDMSGLGQTSF